MNSDRDVYCASCGKPLKNQSVEIEQTTTRPPPGNVERNAIVGCCVLSILLFFFPLLTIRVPIAGEQDVSGYDAFSKITEFREKLKPPDASKKNPYATTPRTLPQDMPLSIRLGWLTPLAIIVAFVCAAIALVTAFKAIHISRIVCVAGTLCAGAAILHITIMNSDLHSWLAGSMKTAPSELKGNPFAGLAENISTLMLNAFQIKPGWAVYALLVLLGLAAVLGFSRVLSRLRVVPAGS